jgi:oligopeptide/dipeptide ABC transporter ATP-binding protein
MSLSPSHRPLLEVLHLGKSYAAGGFIRRKKHRVLHEVSFTVDRGEAVALVGESGSGKSTIARQIIRLETPDRGQILLDGVDVLKSERRPTLGFRRRVQMVFQDPFGSLNPHHTIAYHLERPLLRHRRATRANVREHVLRLLEEVGLVPALDYADKHPHSLSGGQRQRVAIARALAPGPELVLADEPTSMLDVSLRMGILNLLDQKKKQGKLALVFITHDLASARYLADRVLVLYGGQVMESAPSDELVNDARHPYTQLLLSAADRSGHKATTTQTASDPSPKPRPRTRVDKTSGCPFSSRCASALEHCHDTDAPWVEVAASHFARCHLVSPHTPIAAPSRQPIPERP